MPISPDGDAMSLFHELTMSDRGTTQTSIEPRQDVLGGENGHTLAVGHFIPLRWASSSK